MGKLSEGQGGRARSVDCEQCEHFQGRAGWSKVEWACAKGHPAESSYILIRSKGCPDFDQASRDTLIFRRFKSEASFFGDEHLKNRKTQVRRTVTSLAKSLDEFGSVMDGKQVQAGKDAIAALNRLASDIERAAQLAKAHKARMDAERAAEEKRRGDDLIARMLPGWADEDVAACAEDLADLGDTAAGRRWLVALRGPAVLTDSGVWTLRDDVRRWRMAAAPALRAERLDALRRNLASALLGLEQPITRDYATRADFEAYRRWRRDHAAAKASVITVIADAAKRATDGDLLA